MKWIRTSERLPVGKKAAVNTYTVEVGTLTIKEDGAYFETEFSGNLYFYLFNDSSLYEHIIWYESEEQAGEKEAVVKFAEMCQVFGLKYDGIRKQWKDGTSQIVTREQVYDFIKIQIP